MKRLLIIPLALIVAICTVVLVACDKKSQATQTDMFFKVNGYADTVYSIAESKMSPAELTTIISLQGLLAQKKATIYIEGPDGATLERLQQLSQKHDFQIEIADNAWMLIDLFSDLFGNKYVLYNDHSDNTVLYDDQTINYATTISGAESWIMVAKTLEQTAKQHGLTIGADATEAKVNTRYIFETYKDKLNNRFLVHQSPTNRYLRDYAIAGKAMCFYSDFYDGDSSVKADILDWVKENAPILGWTENEVNFVSANSLQSVVTVAADHAVNLSLYSASGTNNLKQSNHTLNRVTAEQGKHYVAIVMSDGDNVQWMTRGFESSSKYYGSQHRGKFPITWTTSPALVDLAPNVLNNLYTNATANDFFIAGPSGVGYVNAAEYNSNWVASYASYTAGYMRESDLNYINFLDNTVDKAMLDKFSFYNQVKGGIWSIGDKYIEGAGAVYWSNDKPFVCARETLWRIAGDDDSNKYYGFVERVAQRINEYSTDCTKIEGYTVVLAHAWSIGSMDGINRFVNELDEDVVLVTVDQLLDLVSTNVKHEDATPNDILPCDLDDILVDISSEQYIWDDVKSTQVTTKHDFVFDSQQTASTWYKGNGGLQYDKVEWTEGDSGGKPAIMMDGSDLDDVVDPLPNSWIYNMFSLSADADKDNYLYCYIGGSFNADVNYRVRALYEENGIVNAVVLNSDGYEQGSVDSYGWYKRTSKSPSVFMYNLGALKGKRVLISIEQDDTGDGSGEIVFVRRVVITDKEMVKVSAFPNWGIDDICDDWKLSGPVEIHGEGVCLEATSTESALSYTYPVSEETKWAKFYVRMFNRPESEIPDTPPQLQLKVNETIVKALNAADNYVIVTTDEYRCIAYDLSSYVGQEITITFSSLVGDHAAVGHITLAENCTLEEVTKLYKDIEIKLL